MRLQTYKSYKDNKVQTCEVDNGNCTKCKGHFLRVSQNIFCFQFETVTGASRVKMSDISGIKNQFVKQSM